MTEKQIKKFISYIFESLKSKSVVEFKKEESEVLEVAMEIVQKELQKEKDLDEEVNKMMDDLESQNPGGFQRYKMFPLLKRKLAEKKGIVL